MPKLSATPRSIGATVLTLALFVVALLAPAADAAPIEGDGNLTVSPAPTVLPKTTVGNQSPTQTLTLGYEGEGEVWINKVTIEGDEAGEFFSNGSNCNNLSAGQSCEAWVGLKPSASGTKHAFLVVQFSGERPAVSFEISGDAVLPQLVITPGNYDFGLQRVNRESVSTTFQVRNSGEAEVQIGNFEISGPGSGAFWTGSSSCWGAWLAPGQSCSMEVWFGAHERTTYEAQLRAWANGSVFTASVSGQGGQAIVATPENPVGFGTAGVGSAGAVRAITLTNSGDLPESFFIGVIAGGDAAGFELLDENCTGAPLAPSGSCTAHVRFAPDSAGAKSARLAFFGDGDGGMLIQLNGEGVAPAVSISPSGFDFGAQARETKSAAHVFAVRNDGAAPVSLGATMVVGANLDQFLLSGDECTGVLLWPGQECLVRLRFAPETVGSKTATLRIGSEAGAFTASLAGSGVAPQKAGAADSRSPSRRSSFIRGAVLSSAKARCRVSGACRKTARASKHGASHRRPAR